MNPNTRVPIAGFAMTASLLLVAAPVPASEPRTKEQCSALFHELNTSGDGRLTVLEASKNSELMTVLTAPDVWKKGYLTEDDFTPLCVTRAPAGSHS